jgi:hypothetical protein
MQDTTTNKTPRKTAHRNALIAAVLSAVVYMAAHAVLKQPALPPAARTLAAILPVPFFLFFLYSELRWIRHLDELEQRIQVEALAFAFPATVVVLMTLGLLQTAGFSLSPEGWNYRNIYFFAMVFYIAGVGVARRRYR